MSAENAIQVQNLEFSYTQSTKVLSIRELSIAKGEHIFLHGPSGCGKTSLLGILTGILKASSGSVRVLGKEMSELSDRRRDSFRALHIGYIFQQFNLIPYLSVLENILLPCWMSRERQERIEQPTIEGEARELAKRLGLESSIDKNILNLSVGQQQRVAVARALIGHPEILIADEPTSSLDEDRQQSFIDLMLERTRIQKTTVLFVSHNRRLADQFDRTISLAEVNTIKVSKKEIS